jgi:hypothetical protein
MFDIEWSFATEEEARRKLALLGDHPLYKFELWIKKGHDLPYVVAGIRRTSGKVETV